MSWISHRTPILLGILVVFTGTILLGLLFSSPQQFSPPSGSPSIPHAAIFGGPTPKARITLEIADTPEERQQGLMHRTLLPEDQGMLFVFDEPGQYPFWMKDTPLPLDLVYISDRFTIVAILPDTTPMDPAFLLPLEEFQYVIEVNGGYSKRHGIMVGDRVIFSGLNQPLSSSGTDHPGTEGMASSPDAAPPSLSSKTVTSVPYPPKDPVLFLGLIAILLAFFLLEGRFSRRSRREFTRPDPPARPLDRPHSPWEEVIESDREKVISSIIEVLNEIDAELHTLQRMLSDPAVILTSHRADTVVGKIFFFCQVAEDRMKKAAAEGYLTPDQVTQLNAELAQAVQRMVAISQVSPVLAKHLPARVVSGR